MHLDGRQRWLLFVHQLPAEPSKLRVKAWRRLQSAGAVKVKNTVYVLPNTPEAREDLEWLRKEIVTDGGEATVFAAETVGGLGTDEIVDAFVRARAADWQELLDRTTALRHRQTDESTDPAEAERELRTLRNRFAQIDKIDFFQAPGRDEVLEALDAIGRAGRATGGGEPDVPAIEPPDVSGHRWVTRPHPGVDRMASAWLVRRFIDPHAVFAFAEEPPTESGPIPFDMFGVDLGHHGDRCTFETLLDTFGLGDPALARLARIVHDLDLRKDSATDGETSTIGRMVKGLRQQEVDDPTLLERGIALFDALYNAFRSEVPER